MWRVLTATLAAGILLTAASGSAALAPAWVVAPPVPMEKDNDEGVLRDVSVLSPTDVWVVGWSGETHGTLAAHWDGASWTRVPTPDSPERFNVFSLNAVDAVAPDDVWAVGGILDLANPKKVKPLFLHYDGVAWTRHPGLSGVDGELTDVDLLTADEGWAVGTNQDRPFIVRRTAGGWESVPAPVFEGAAVLESVHATSSGDAWAVGSRQRGTAKAALVLHWDGGRWSEVTIPGPPPGNTALINVAATSASDVWAVGSQCSAALCLPWVLHLTGATWRTEQTAPGAELTSVVAFAPDDVWIFGQATTSLTVLDHIEHWDGTLFTTDTNVPPATVDPHHPASALSLAAASGDRRTRTMWAVGWIQGIGRSTHAVYRN